MGISVPTLEASKTIPSEMSYPQAYAELKRLVKEKGLLKKQPGYYVYKTLEPLVLMAISIAILLLVDSFWVQLANAVFLSLAFVLMGLIMHDAGHRQIFEGARRNDILGLIYANLLLGSSISGWRERHNTHHAQPNVTDVDPTLNIPLWAWTEEEAREAKGIKRFFVKHQALTFFPVLSLSAFFQGFSAFRDVLTGKGIQDRFMQGLFLVLHFVLYFGLLFTALPWWQALIFFMLNFLVMGLHLGMIFAPNHKGMPIIEQEHGLDFLYLQAYTTRNVRPGLLVDYLYGGLNYQLEHHLFPGMARNQLGGARMMVKAFCQERGIPYHETGVLRSYRDILAYMHETGAPLRR